MWTPTRATIVLIATLCVATASTTFAAGWQPLGRDEEMSRMVRNPAPEPTHLTPTGEMLGNRVGCAAGFDVVPSFEASRHWCLQSPPYVDGNRLRVWSLPEGAVRDGPCENPRGLTDAYGPITPIPEDLAEQLHGLWLSVVLQARYPRVDSSGMDGVEYCFSATRYALPGGECNAGESQRQLPQAGHVMTPIEPPAPP